MSRTHLHHDDAPLALGILSELLAGRDRLPAGYEPTEAGAYVDWDDLAGSYLSSSEVAAVRIAQGCALAERVGGIAPRTRAPVARALEWVTAPR